MLQEIQVKGIPDTIFKCHKCLGRDERRVGGSGNRGTLNSINQQSLRRLRATWGRVLSPAGRCQNKS